MQVRCDACHIQRSPEAMQAPDIDNYVFCLQTEAIMQCGYCYFCKSPQICELSDEGGYLQCAGCLIAAMVQQVNMVQSI